MFNREFQYLKDCVGVAVFANDADVPKTEIGGIYLPAVRQNQIPAVSDCFSSFGVELPKNINSFFSREYSAAVSHDIRVGRAALRICSAFASAGVKLVLMSGFMMRRYYPKPVYRYTDRLDAVIDEADATAAADIMQKIGFSLRNDDGGVMVFTEDTGKMTAALLKAGNIGEKVGVTARFLRRAYDEAVPVKSRRSVFRMTNEHFYTELVLSSAYRFAEGRFGVRDVTDIGVFLRRFGDSLDREKTAELLGDIGLTVFEEQLSALASCWFFGGARDEFTDIMERAAFCCQQPENPTEESEHVKNKRSRFALLFIFPPFKTMKEQYPFLGPLPILLPFMYIVRIFSLVIFRKKYVDKRIKGAHSLLSDEVTREELNAALNGMGVELS